MVARNQSSLANRSRWRCGQCGKSLSSKRSYDEHMNVHNDQRPFQCDKCKYAAASQMTLRRHKLRNHAPREEWGYHCPHCKESYMEPASYTVHVSTRHAGLPSVFGCTCCRFATKSSKHFREHMMKHINVVHRRTDPLGAEKYSVNLSEYLVDDETGRASTSVKPRYEQTKKTFSTGPIRSIHSTDTPFPRSTAQLRAIIPSTKGNIVTRFPSSVQRNDSSWRSGSKIVYLKVDPSINESRRETGATPENSDKGQVFRFSSTDWIQAEVVIDGTQCAEFDLGELD